MDLPREIVSKIMTYHSNIRFDKDELLNFIEDWNYVKDCLDEPDWHMFDIISNNAMLRKYYEKNKKRFRMEHLYDEYRLWEKP